MLRQSSEFQVIGEASDGLEAVERAAQSQPDLILLDIGLPRLNGIEAAGRISAVSPASKVLFLSQNSDPEVVEAALSDGARGYVLKSQAGCELLLAMTAALRNERFVSGRLADAQG
jgi:DNA-binding NarL/FixJ family response regulator